VNILSVLKKLSACAFSYGLPRVALLMRMSRSWSRRR